MSDRVVQSCHDGDRRAGQSIHSYQSVWMAHWTRTSCRVAPHVHNHMSLHIESNDHDANKHPLLSGLEMAADVSSSAKGFKEVTEARTVRIMNEDPTSSRNMVNERPDSLPFPMFKLPENISSRLDSKFGQEISCHSQVSRPQINCNLECNVQATTSHSPPVIAVTPAIEASSRASVEGVSQSPEELVKPLAVVRDGSLTLAGPSHENFSGPTLMVPIKSRKGKNPVSLSLMDRQEEDNQLSSVLASKEHLSSNSFTPLGHEHNNYDDCSALFVGKKKQDNYLTSVGSGMLQLKQNSVQDPLIGSYHLPVLVEEHSQKVQNRPAIEFFPICKSPPDTTKSEKPFHGCYSLQRIQGSIHDVESMRICTTNSLEGLAGGPGAFSQATQSLLFMKKMDLNFSNKNQTFGESSVSKKLKGSIFSELLNFTTPLGQNKQRVELQPLGSLSESEEKDNIEHAKISEVHLKNESSADTDTMDLDAFKEQNYHSGVTSSPSKKDLLLEQNATSLAPTVSTREEIQHGSSIPTLANMNEEISAIPATASSMDNEQPSPSKTESLDAEHLLFHSEQPSNPNPNPYSDVSPTQEPSSRWLKRLRLNVSDSFAHGTKSSTLGEFSSHEKVNKLFNKIMRGAKSSSSESVFHKSIGKEETAVDQNAIVLWNGGSSSADSVDKGREKLLSHSWIRRWCHSQAGRHQKKPEAVVVCDPDSTKVELAELQNKQFPSLAAMALMGKAMTGFQPCEFQNRGSFVVWNTKGS
ncbi:hypothetical protein NMG60_11015438 [Bertholletia excelsa]